MFRHGRSLLVSEEEEKIKHRKAEIQEEKRKKPLSISLMDDDDAVDDGV